MPIVCGLLDRIIKHFDDLTEYLKSIEYVFEDADWADVVRFTDQLFAPPALEWSNTINKIGHLMAVRDALSPLPLPISTEIYARFADQTEFN